MSMFAKQLEDLKRSQKILDEFKQKGVTEAANDIEKFQKRLNHLLKKFTKAKDGDEDDRESVVEDYENVEYNESKDQKFTLKIRSIIEKYTAEYPVGYYDVITQDRWKSLRANGLTNEQIKTQDQTEKQDIDQTLSKYTMKENKCSTSAYKHQELRIVLIGKTGVGKSATGNTLLGRKAFTVSNSPESVTQVIKLEEMKVDGRRIRIIDTPGIFDTVRDMADVQNEIAKVIVEFNEGVHAFVLVRNASHYRLTKEEIDAIEELKRLFGANVMKYCILLFTHADAKFKTEPLSSWVANMADGKLRQIMQQVNKQVIGVNNSWKTEYERIQQRNNFVQMADKVQENMKGQVYTNELFQGAKKQREETARRREEERQRKLNEEQKKFVGAQDMIKKFATSEADQALKSVNKENIKQFDLSRRTADILQRVRGNLSSNPDGRNALTLIEGFPDGSNMVKNLVADCVLIRLQIKEVELRNQAAADAKRKCIGIIEQYIQDNLSTMKNTSVSTITDHVTGQLSRNEIVALGSVQEQVEVSSESVMYQKGLQQLTREVENIKNSSNTQNLIQGFLDRVTKELDDKVKEKVDAFVRGKNQKELQKMEKNQSKMDGAVTAICSQVRSALSSDAKSYLTDDTIKSNVKTYIAANREHLKNIAKKVKCFPADATVFTLQKGEVVMSELEVGDLVPVMTARGSVSYEEVYLFSHGDPNAKSEFVVIATESGHTLTLSPGHLLPIGESDELREAGQVKVGDLVYIHQGDSFLRTRVANLHMEYKVGLYCPHTASGTIVVDGVVASCYTSGIHPSLARLMLLPARFLYAVLPRPWYDHLAAYNPQSGMPKVVHKYRHYFI